MKKITLLILFGFLWSWVSVAQVPIGSQDGTTSNTPITSCQNYSYTQQIVHQDEINAVPGDITSISFYFDNTTGSNVNSSDWTIYLGNTTKESFTNNADWVAYDQLTEVFSGTVTYPAQGNFMLITFDTPYPYTNVDNLVIAVDENGSGSDCTNYFGKTAALGVPRSIYYASSTVNPDPSAPPVAQGRATYINNMILGGIQESCPAPSDLAVVAVSDTTADVSWTENGSATEWEILYGPAGFNPVTQGTVLEADGTPTATITGLTSNTNYEFYVQALCGVDDNSARIGPMAFRTTCGVATLPYMLNFEEVTVPALPLCTLNENLGSGNDWTTATYNSRGFTGKLLKYNYNFTNPANTWFYTQGVQLEVGETYQISYQYGSGSSSYVEKMKVAFGTVPMASGMTTILADYPNINHEALEATNTFTVPADGVYYFGFHAYSATNQLALYVDNIEVFVAPTCIEPTDLSVDAVSAYTADLSWTEVGPATEWEVLYGPVGFDPATQGTVETVTGTPETTLTGLNSNTIYDFYVTAICTDDDQSFMAGPESFRTPCVPEGIPFIEGFETGYLNGEDLDGCWSQASINGTQNWTVNNLTANNRTPRTGNYNVTLRYSNEDWMFYPLDLEGDSTYELIFYARQDGSIGSNASIMASFGTVNTPAGMTGEIVPSSQLINGDYQEFSGYFTPATSGTYFIGIKGTINGSPWYISVDDISVEDAGGCLRPRDLQVTAVSSDSADIEWTESGSATEWDIIYGETGFDPVTEGTTVTATVDPEITLTGLNSNTTYQFYVKAVCDADESSLVGPVTFITSCVPEGIPFEEGFETGYLHNVELSGCWSQTSITGDQTWTVNNTFTDYNRTPRSGGFNVFLRYGNEDWMYYPLDLTEGVAYELSFYARQNSATGVTVEAAFGTNNVPAAMTTTIIQSSQVVAGDYQKFTGYFTPAASGTYFIGIKGTLTGAPWYLSVDDINVVEAPGCIPPQNLNVGIITETTAEVSWLPISTETQWEVTYGAAGFNPETAGTTIVVNDTPETTLTDLISDTGYEFYVRAICGDDDESELSSPKYFFTGYCEFTSTSTSYYISDFFTEEGIINISNLNSGLSPNGYGNFTNMQVLTYPTSSFNFEVEFNGTSTYGFNMWIDYNGNMEFEDSEKVYGSGSYVSRASGTIVIPAGIANGNYRMRIVADWLSTNPNSCGANNTAEAEDYTVTIIDVPTCMPPADVTVVGVGMDTAQISWTSQDRETEWNVIYGETGFDLETEGTTLVVDGTPEVTLTDLDSNTRYDVYVQAICEVDDLSFITGPVSFWTNCTATSVPYLMDFETAIVPELPNCTAGENVGSGNMWTTLDYNSNGFIGNVLRYAYSSSAANAWFYTQGIEMLGGVEYKISYTYGNVSTTWTEKMKVAVGTGTGAGAMTTVLADYPNINEGAPLVDTVTFTVPDDGVYYFGFNVYSPGNQFNLYLDDIHVQFAAECDAVTGVEITDVTSTSVTVSWTESATATEGYEVNVFLQGADPSTDTPEASATVAAGITTATVEGLTADTLYDVYVTSDCGNGNVTMSQGVSFDTIDLGVSGNDYTQINYFPNPVKDQLTITAANSIENVTVYNLLGQRILEVQPNGLEVVLDMQSLPTGTYVLRANVANSVSTFKVIKE